MLKFGSAGKTIRARRLFNPETDKSVIVAMDHGKQHGAIQGLEKIREVLEFLIQEGPDAILINPGILRLTYDLWKGRQGPGIVVAADIPVRTSIPGSEDMGLEYKLLSTVEEIVSLGADAIKVLLIFCRTDLRSYADNLRDLAQVIKVSDQFGIPVMVEATLWGTAQSKNKKRDANLVADICRVSMEMGADLLKVPFLGTPEDFRKVTEITPIPVMVLGGAKTSDLGELFVMVEQILQANVSGLVFGRNVWQHPNPHLVLHALKRMVHQGATKEDVLKEFSI